MKKSASTVKDLINFLQSLDQDSEVFVLQTRTVCHELDIDWAPLDVTSSKHVFVSKDKPELYIGDASA